MFSSLVACLNYLETLKNPDAWGVAPLEQDVLGYMAQNVYFKIL